MARDLRSAEHLPKRSPSGEAAPPEELPRQRRGITPQLHGRYPDHDVLAQTQHWDAATRSVVLDRVGNVPPIRFFDAAEERALRAFCDVVLAQDAEPRIPVLAMVDRRLCDGELDGFRYADMPPDPETWRQVARGLDDSARERGADDFAAADVELQRELVGAFQRGELEWGELPVKRAFSVVMRMVLAAFYSHPWAWNEIGFGGPAYPRGYARMGLGQREWWEGAAAFSTDPVSDVQERGLE